jgi:hypothetical protein
VISGQRTGEVLPGCFGHCFRVYYYFLYHSLVAICYLFSIFDLKSYNVALAETHTQESPNLKEVMKIMEANQKEIKVYSDVSEENFLHLYLISQAGIEKLSGKFTEAIELLGDAAESATAGGFTRIFYPLFFLLVCYN